MPTIDTITVAYGDHSASTDAISAAGLQYLLQYGWSQSLQDSVAGVAKEVRDAAKAACNATGDAMAKAEAKWARLVKEADVSDMYPDLVEHVDRVIAGVTNARQSKRADAIMAGTVGSAVRGPRLPTMERMIREIAEENIRATYATKKAAGANLGPLPKGADFTAIVDRFIAKRGDEFRAEAERRMALVTGAGDDADELLGNLIG